MVKESTAPKVDLDAVGVELIARARAMKPTLQKRAGDSDKARRVSIDTHAELRAADLFRATVPEQYGGYELPPRYFWRIGAELAKGCASTAWVYCVLSAHTFLFGLFPKEGQDEIFGSDPSVAICGVLPDKSTARKVDGGYMLKNSRWPFASGCHNATWAMLGAEIEGEPYGYDKAFFMVPREAIKIADDWHVTGLKATGSNSLNLMAEELFVPAHHVLTGEVALAHKLGNARSRLYRTPTGPLLALALGLGPSIGAAEAALEEFEDLVLNRSHRKMIYTDDVRKTDLPATRRCIADATVRLEAARMLADRACDLAWEAAGQPNQVVNNKARARMRLFGVHAAHECREIVNMLYLESGGSALHESNPMQRLNRDVQAMTMHEALHLGTIQDVYGRVRLNKATTHWLL